MEGDSFEINVLVDEQIACQLFSKKEHGDLTLMEVKGTLLEDVSEVDN